MTKKAGRRGALVAMAGALLLSQGAALAADPLRVTKPVNATKDDLSPQRTYQAPFLVADPSNPKIILGGFLEFRTRQCGLVRSMDGGQSWKILDANPAIKSQPYCLANNSNVFQAPLAWGKDHALYLATQAWDETTRTQTSVIVAKSTNYGDSWTTVFARDARTTKDNDQENDRPVTGLLVDTTTPQDTVYVLYRRAYQNRTAPNAAPQNPVVAVSHDAGKTFNEWDSAIGNVFTPAVADQALSARTTIPGTTTTTAVAGSLGATPNNPANFGNAGNGQGFAMDNKGNLYVAYMSASANVTPSAPSAIIISKSTDHAKTWTSYIARPFSYENGQNPRLTWSPGGGPEGTLHIVWEWRHPPEVNSYADLGYIRSTDGGKTWTQARTIADDDPARLAGKYLPMISTSPNGRVDVAWWDTRNDPGIRSQDVYYTYSTDDGKTWSKNIRMTDQVIDRRYGVWSNNFDQNEPPGLLSTNQYAMVSWDDTRFSTGPDGKVVGADPTNPGGPGIGSGVQDIFTSAVQFKALGGGSSKVAKGILAGVVGLLAVGVVLTLAATISRRRKEPAVAGGTSAKSPAAAKK